jgi:uncharacterized membrane protein
MDEHLQEDWLDARLREEAPYIDDAGFTARVLQKLPARQTRRSLREAILLCVTLLASAVTYTVSDEGRFLVSAVNRLASMPLLFILCVAIFCALVMTAIAAGAAFSKVRGDPLG